MTLTNHCVDVFKHHFQVSFMRILGLREVARTTSRIALEFAPEFVYMVVVAENTNNSTIRYEKKLKFMEQPIGPAPDPETADPDTIDKYYDSVNLEEAVACIMLSRRWSVSKLLSLEDEELLGHFRMPRLYVAELHAMLKLHEKGIPKNAETPTILAIREGKIQKDKKKPRGAKGKDKGKTKLAYAPKPKIPPSPKREIW
ncbi:hypothetical protein Tco_0853003 [Tanacetum coccineum]